jgi:hypothetical protein
MLTLSNVVILYPHRPISLAASEPDCDDSRDEESQSDDLAGRHVVAVDQHSGESGADRADSYPHGVGGPYGDVADCEAEQNHARREGSQESDRWPQPGESPGGGQQRRPNDLQEPGDNEDEPSHGDVLSAPVVLPVRAAPRRETAIDVVSAATNVALGRIFPGGVILRTETGRFAPRFGLKNAS